MNGDLASWVLIAILNIGMPNENVVVQKFESERSCRNAQHFIQLMKPNKTAVNCFENSENPGVSPLPENWLRN